MDFSINTLDSSRVFKLKTMFYPIFKTLSKILSEIGRKRGIRLSVLRTEHWLTKKLLKKVAFS